MNYVSPQNSKVLAGKKPVIIADGTALGAIKIRLRDHKNKPVSGRQVELYTDDITVQITQPGLTDAEGLCVGYASKTTPGNVSIFARVLPNCIDSTDLLLSENNEILLVEPQTAGEIIGLKLEAIL